MTQVSQLVKRSKWYDDCRVAENAKEALIYTYGSRHLRLYGGLRPELVHRHSPKVAYAIAIESFVQLVIWPLPAHTLLQAYTLVMGANG